MNRRILAFCLLAALGGADVLAGQTLGGLAQQEEERRKAIKAPARVITDKDLKPVPGPAPDAAPTPPAPTASPTGTVPVEERVPVAAAQYRDGALPRIPVEAISGGEVLLEVTVSSAGRVTGVKTLRHTPPFTDALTASVRSWQFRPAEDAAAPKQGEVPDPKTRKPVESKVLVIGVFRPPALYSTTLGDAPKDVAVPADEIPFPLASATMPLYPPLAVTDAVVLTELRVAVDGKIANAAVVRPVAGFDQPTLDAIRTLVLRPARIHGMAAAKFAYVVSGFRRPVTPTGSCGPNENCQPK